MTTAPPRRGSPAPASSPVAGSRRTACAPPKKTLSARNGASLRPAAASAAAATAGAPDSSAPVPCPRGAPAPIRGDHAAVPGRARRLARRREVEGAVDDPEDDLEDRRADAVRARGAE